MREELAHLIDRLGARFGLRRVTRLVPHDTHIPEYAVAAVPAHAVKTCLPRRHLRAGQARRGAADPAVCQAASSSRSSRRCLMARLCAFDWRHEGECPRLAADGSGCLSEGPERIAMEWWRDDRGNNLTRDYFRVESEAALASGFIARVRSAAKGCHAGICMGFLHERHVLRVFCNKPSSAKCRAMPSWLSPPIFLFCVALPIPKNLSSRRRNLGLTGIGIADRNSVAGVVRALTQIRAFAEEDKERQKSRKKFRRKRSSRPVIQTGGWRKAGVFR